MKTSNIMLLKIILIAIAYTVLSLPNNNNNNAFRPSQNQRQYSGRMDQSSRERQNENRDELPEYQREQLYEAYNLLHSLAQVFKTIISIHV